MPAAKWSISVELPVLTPFRALQRKLRVLTECAECSWRVQCRYLKIRTLSFPWEDLGKNLNRALWCMSLSVGSFKRDNTFQTQENIFRFIIIPKFRSRERKDISHLHKWTERKGDAKGDEQLTTGWKHEKIKALESDRNTQRTFN